MTLSTITKTLLTAALLVPSMAKAATDAPTDSVSAAMATVIAGYIKPTLEKQLVSSPTADFRQFIEGVKKAFSADSSETLYYDGLTQGMNMKSHLDRMRKSGYPINDSLFILNFVKAFDGQPTGFTAESAGIYLDNFLSQAKKADSAEQQAFLDAQASREGVIRTPSGLLFEVITEGEGNTPRPTDTVEAFYTGRLADGTVFDQTDRTPAKFPVNRLIKGFSEGLQMMKPGGKYRLFIPANLGYGDNGAGDVIPGGAALDFTVTLVRIIE